MITENKKITQSEHGVRIRLSVVERVKCKTTRKRKGKLVYSKELIIFG